jgi:ferredoxin
MKLQMGEVCKHNLRVRCLQFGQQAIDSGLAREITKEEVYEILKKGEQEGLVLQPENKKKEVKNICMCCNCCCAMLSPAKNLSKPAQLFATNYYAEVDSTICEGCGICVDRCPMNAISVNGVSIIDRDKCIGCGLCIPTCPSKAIHLKNKEEVIVPPEDWADNHAKVMKKRRDIGQLENNP